MSPATFHSLRPFSATASELQLHCAVTRGKPWVLHYRLQGELEQLLIPAVKSSGERRDGLWQHTCLELFVGLAGSENYFELNLSPTGDWNFYSFTGYRQGMQEVEATVPKLILLNEPGQKTWQVEFMPPKFDSRVLAVGVTTVLEYVDGHREYWALDHRGQKPDFHLRESFCLKI